MMLTHYPLQFPVPFDGMLLLEGDMQDGTDRLLLEGDMQDGTDVLQLEGFQGHG